MNVNDDSAGRVRLSHSGAFALGASTSMVMMPSARLGIIVLTNGIPLGVPEAIGATFMDLASLGRVERDWYEAYRALMKSQFSHSGRLAGRKRPTDARPARVLRRYTGVYLNRLYGPARVILRGRRLVLRIGPKPLRFRLDHWSGNTFFYTPSGENASGRAAIDFRFNRRSRGAVSIRIENLDPEGQGLFRRKLHFAQKSPRRR